MTDQKAAGEVTREHRLAATKLVQPIYQSEDSELRDWVETGDEDAGKWWICDCTVAHAAQQIADAEARGHASACHQRDQRIAELEAEAGRLETQLKKAWVQLMGKGDPATETQPAQDGERRQ